MTHVATLIANPAAPVVDEASAERARAALPNAGPAEWLCPGIAADIPFTAGTENDNRILADRVRAAMAESAIDVVVQPRANRRKSLLLADMDSTMIGQECIDELAAQVGLREHVAAITERAMRGEIEFESALRERVALLKGLEATVIAAVIRDRIRLTPGARTLVATMRAHGAYTCLVSGGFTSFTGPVGKMIGFDEARSNVLLSGEDGALLGTVAEPILGQQAKVEALLDLRARRNCGPQDTLAIGDGANDIPMIQQAGLGIAYHAKPKVAAAAAARIDHSDLTAVLYIQGYREEQFAG